MYKYRHLHLNNQLESGVITIKWYQSQVHNSCVHAAILSACCQSALSGCLLNQSAPAHSLSVFSAHTLGEYLTLISGSLFLQFCATILWQYFCSMIHFQLVSATCDCLRGETAASLSMLCMLWRYSPYCVVKTFTVLCIEDIEDIPTKVCAWSWYLVHILICIFLYVTLQFWMLS